MSKKNTLKTLTDIGFLAASNGYINETKAIVNGLKKTSPFAIGPYIILALLELNRANYPKALSILREAETIAPNNGPLNAYMGLTQQLMGQYTDSQPALYKAINSNDASTTSLAKYLLAQPLDMTKAH